MKNRLALVFLFSLLFVSCQVKPTSTLGFPKTPTPEETLQATRTPRATFTPFVVPTPFLTPGVKTYTIPEWLKSTDNNVALLADRNEAPDFWAGEFNQITFIDVEAGESITFEVEYFDEVFWQDRNKVVFLHAGHCMDFRYISILDLLTGEVARYGTDNNNGGDYCPDQSFQNSRSVSMIMFDLPVPEHDIFTGEGNDSGSQIEEYTSVAVAVSPDNRKGIVLQRTESEKPKTRFEIYDFVSMDLIDYYYDLSIDKSFIILSDSKMVFYLSGNTPCVLDLELLTADCGVPLSDDIFNPYIRDVLSDDGLLAVGHDQSFGNDVYYADRLCIYNIWTSDIVCPMDDLDFLSLDKFDGYETRYVANYEISPDRKFVAFNYGYGCPTCDYYDGVGRAIVSVDGDLLNNFDNYRNYGLKIYWRPLK